MGCRPTVSEDPKIGVETYLYDFADRLYGQDITVQLLAYRRPEMRFDSLESLCFLIIIVLVSICCFR